MVAYHQNDSNSPCLIVLEYAFTVLEENNSASAIVMQIEESLYCQYQGYKNRVEFSNAIMARVLSF